MRCRSSLRRSLHGGHIGLEVPDLRRPRDRQDDGRAVEEPADLLRRRAQPFAERLPRLRKIVYDDPSGLKGYDPANLHSFEHVQDLGREELRSNAGAEGWWLDEITKGKGASLNFRWPYHAIVMNAFDATSSSTTVIVVFIVASV